jgi:hypothetical protein
VRVHGHGWALQYFEAKGSEFLGERCAGNEKVFLENLISH